MPLVPGKDWNNQQNIYHRWLKGETKAQREKIQKLIPAVLAILPRELRHRLCIFDTPERRALLAAQEALSTAIDAHDDAVQGRLPESTFQRWWVARRFCRSALIEIDRAGLFCSVSVKCNAASVTR